MSKSPRFAMLLALGENRKQLRAELAIVEDVILTTRGNPNLNPARAAILLAQLAKRKQELIDLRSAVEAAIGKLADQLDPAGV